MPTRFKLSSFWLKSALWALCLLPLGLLAWRAFSDRLGANPIESLEHSTGIWSLRFLILGLCLTPLRQLTGQVAFVQARRLLGLWAFTYAFLHFLIYLVFDLELSFAKLGKEVVKRPYILVGFLALMALVPLAITSTQGWQRRLKRAWKQLHRLVYVAILLGGLHFLVLVKTLKNPEPWVYFGLILAVLALRLPVVERLLQRRFTAS
jgi:sulfoxide reductase heme-binding subunit YedZ